MRPIPFLRLSAMFIAAGLVVVAPSSRAASAAASGTAATGSAASGSGTASKSAAPATKVAVTFKTISVQGSVRGVYYRNGSMTVGLSAQEITPSANTYSYTGNATMEILGPGAPSNAPAQDTSSRAGSGTGRARNGNRGGAPSGPLSPVGSVTFPKSGDYMLYLFTEADGGVSAAAVTNEASQFPIGSMRAVNTTNIPMEMKMDADWVPFKPGDSITLPFKNADEFPLILQRTDTDPHSRVLGNPMAKPSPGMRTTLILTISNIKEVQTQNAAPNFTPVLINDTGKANQVGRGSQASGSGRRGNRGGTGGGGG